MNPYTNSTSYITWKDYYSVGDDAIDSQHKQIIEMINCLYRAMQLKDDRQVLKSLLKELVQYAVRHFQYEEKVMLEHNYPDLANHKSLHDKLRQRTVGLCENAGLVTGRDLLVFLKEWWCNHIQDEDKKYAPYLQQKLVDV
jgi:hemerythrin-like metal-binding protein